MRFLIKGGIKIILSESTFSTTVCLTHSNRQTGQNMSSLIHMLSCNYGALVCSFTDSNRLGILNPHMCFCVLISRWQVGQDCSLATCTYNDLWTRDHHSSSFFNSWQPVFRLSTKSLLWTCWLLKQWHVLEASNTTCQGLSRLPSRQYHLGQEILPGALLGETSWRRSSYWWIFLRVVQF